jgi:hypothetical protein
MAMTTNQIAWARWLAFSGLPRAHIARVLDCPHREVLAACKPRAHGLTRYHVPPVQARRIRRLRREGLTYVAIGLAEGIPWYVAKRCCRSTWKPADPRPPRTSADRPGIRSITATRFRRLIELGYGPVRAAELLAIDPAEALDLADRIESNGRVRPRPRSSAGWSDAAADLAAGDVAPELLPVEPQIAVELPPTVAVDDPDEWRNFRRGDGG